MHTSYNPMLMVQDPRRTTTERIEKTNGRPKVPNRGRKDYAFRHSDARQLGDNAPVRKQKRRKPFARTPIGFTLTDPFESGFAYDRDDFCNVAKADPDLLHDERDHRYGAYVFDFDSMIEGLRAVTTPEELEETLAAEHLQESRTQLRELRRQLRLAGDRTPQFLQANLWLLAELELRVSGRLGYDADRDLVNRRVAAYIKGKIKVSPEEIN